MPLTDVETVNVFIDENLEAQLDEAARGLIRSYGEAQPPENGVKIFDIFNGIRSGQEYADRFLTITSQRPGNTNFEEIRALGETFSLLDAGVDFIASNLLIGGAALQSSAGSIFQDLAQFFNNAYASWTPAITL